MVSVFQKKVNENQTEELLARMRFRIVANLENDPYETNSHQKKKRRRSENEEMRIIRDIYVPNAGKTCKGKFRVHAKSGQ